MKIGSMNRIAAIALLAAFGAIAYASSASSSSSSPSDKLVVVGLRNSRSVAEAVPVPAYERFLSTALGAVNESMTPVLQKRSAAPAETRWDLNSIGVGLGLSGQIGLGPIINVTVSPQLRLVFTDSKNPVYPD